MRPPTADERHGARPPAVKIATFCFFWLTGGLLGKYRRTATRSRARRKQKSAFSRKRRPTRRVRCALLLSQRGEGGFDRLIDVLLAVGERDERGFELRRRPVYAARHQSAVPSAEALAVRSGGIEPRAHRAAMEEQ